MELGTVKQINIDTEMQASYLDYAMSVIVARALPDVRDGLKPVHRRILYAMHDLGLRPDQPYKKSARIVGEVLGKYHPHGDAAVYEAMVRMAQDFSLRYPLVDGQGNFGSVDGDNAAAMRYTEARLAKVALEMLNDIDKDTVEWTDNFDGTLKEPSVLPAALPNLLVNGSSGIAVGMSTNIPPHNLGEVCDALCYLIDHYDQRENVTIEDLMKFIPGPDFPTGGVVFRYGAPGEDGEREDMIAKAYASGRGHITVQAKAHIEEMSRNRSRIVVTELPYASNKSSITERIAELAREGRIEGLTDLRDESDRTGMRLCIEMTRTVEPREVLAHLYKHTPLQQTFGISLLALVGGEPRMLSLKRLLLHFIEHRQDVIVRRTKHDLAKAKQRAHILEGLLKALDILDEVIALIRGSRTADLARRGLMTELGFTDIQAQAILDMQLRRLAALERKKLQDEYREVIALIKELEGLLASPKKVLALIRQNLVDLKATYGDARRTQITDQARGALTVTDVLPDEEAWVTLRQDGTVGRAPGRLAAGAAGLQMVLGANTHCDLYLVSSRGQATRIGVHQLPEGAGVHHADLGGLQRTDRIAAAFTARKPNGEPPEGQLVLATALGAIKRINLADLAAAAQANPTVIKLDENDELAWTGFGSGGGEIMLATARGQVIRFAEDEVRPMGLPAGGIAGIKLQNGDRVIGGAVIPAGSGEGALALVSAAGFARRSPLSEFPAKGRGTQGVTAKLSTKGGQIVSAFLVAAADKLWFALADSTVKTVSAKAIPAASRTNAGKVVVAMRSGQQVQRALLMPSGGIEPEPADGGARAPARKSARARKEPKPAPAEAPKSATRAAKVTGTAERVEAGAPGPEPVRTSKPRATKAAAKGAEVTAPAPEPVRTPRPRSAQAAAAESTKAAGPQGAQAAARRPVKGADSAEGVKSPQPARAAAKPAGADEVVSRRGKPAVLARPDGSGQLFLVPPELDVPAAGSEPKAAAKTQPAPKTRPAAKAQPEVKAQPTAKTQPAAKTQTAAKAKPAAKIEPATQTPPAAKAKRAEAQPAAKPEAKPARSRARREPEAEFEPKPKATSSRAAPGDAEGDIRTTWSPAPPRRVDEPPPAQSPQAKKPTRKR